MRHVGCTRPPGPDAIVSKEGDCVDTNAMVFPGSMATEVPGDGIDTDCDGIDACTDLNCDGRPDVAIPSHYDGDYMSTQPRACSAAPAAVHGGSQRRAAMSECRTDGVRIPDAMATAVVRSRGQRWPGRSAREGAEHGVMRAEAIRDEPSATLDPKIVEDESDKRRLSLTMPSRVTLAGLMRGLAPEGRWKTTRSRSRPERHFADSFAHRDRAGYRTLASSLPGLPRAPASGHPPPSNVMQC